MTDDLRREGSADLTELVRMMRELASRVEQLERRLNELADPNTDLDTREVSRSLRPANHPLESRIGLEWLNKIGVVAVLFGVAYLLRYAFVNQWISAAAWIWLGVCAGIAVILASEWFRGRAYRVLSLSLKATGMGVSYLSLWAGFALYNLLSGRQAFRGLVLLTAFNAALAVRESSEVLAALALIGGFLTPLLISIPARETPLFAYIALLDCATAAVVLKPEWWRLLLLGLLGTILLYSTWYFKHYTPADLPAAVVATTVFFAVFCATATCVRRRLSGGWAGRFLAFLEVINPVLYLVALYLVVNPVRHHALAIPALALSGLYFGLARHEGHGARLGANRFLAVYAGLGVAFMAVALTVLLPLDWLSLGWFLEAAVAMAIGFWRDFAWLRSGALLLLCAAVVKAFTYDVWQLALGYRTLSFIALGILLLVTSFAYQRYGLAMIRRVGQGTGGRQP